MKTLVVGGSGFIGSYLMKEIPAVNLDLKIGLDVRNGIKNEYDQIVFLACNQANTLEAYQENYEMFQALEEYRKKYPDTYLVYVSSAAIYDMANTYAFSKKLGEAFATCFDNAAILRLSNVYGHGDGHGAPDKFMNGEKEIHGDGGQIRDLIPVEAVIINIINCLDERIVGVFNVSSGQGITVNQMFKAFGEGKPYYNAKKDFGVAYSVLKPGPVDED